MKKFRKIGLRVLVLAILFAISSTLNNVQAQSPVVGDTIKKDGLFYKVTKLVTGNNEVVLVPQNSSSPYYSTYPSGDITIASPLVHSAVNYNVVGIETNAFNFSQGISSMTIPETVKKIGNKAFENCYAMTTFTINGNGLDSIGDAAFRSCMSLETINLGTGLKVIGQGAFESCDALKQITFPASLKVVGERAFRQSKLEKITLPSSVEFIAKSAFSSSRNLQTLTFNNSVAVISDQAFHKCSKLKTINLGNAIKKIGESAFAESDSLSTITIPATVENIGKAAFADCPNLTNIDVATTNTEYSSHEGVLFDHAKDTLFSYPVGKKDVTYTIPTSVKVINNRAFAGNKSFVYIKIPDNVKKINEAAFADNKNLNYIEFGSGITNIGDRVFEASSKLALIISKITITNLTTGTLVFDNTAIKNAKLFVPNGQKTNYEQDNQWKKFVNISEMSDFVEATEITMNPATKKIGINEEFQLSLTFTPANASNQILFWKSKNPGVATVTDEGIVKGIKAGTAEIEAKILESTVSAIATITVANDTVGNRFKVGKLYYQVTHIDPYEVELVSEQAEHPYWSTKPTGEITVPATVEHDGKSYVLKNIQKNALYSCSEITAVTISEGVKTIGDNAFYGCSELTSVKFPETLEQIGAFAFYSCTKLTSLDLPQSLKKIEGSGAFQDCSELQSVKFPETLEQIGSNNFKGCTKLTSLDLPKSLKKIGNGAFEGCSGLSKIISHIENDIDKVLGSYVFFGVEHSTCKLFVPAAHLATYKATEQWKDFTNIAAIVLVESISLDITEKALKAEEKFTLTATVLPADAINKKVMWSSDKPAIATVDENGEVTGVDRGTAIITATTEDGNKTATCSVIVSTPPKVGDKFKLDSLFYKITKLNPLEVAVVVENEDYEEWTEENKPTGSIIITETIEYEENTYKVTSMGDGVFYECAGITSISIPNSVKSIGGTAFYNCTELKSVNIPDSLKTLNYSTFEGCKKLTSITIPASVESIGGSAFAYCPNLLNIVSLMDTAFVKKPLGFAAFKNLPANAKLYVPVGTKATYKGSTSWTNVFADERIIEFGKLTISGVTAESKEYDGTTVATLADSAVLDGFVVPFHTLAIVDTAVKAAFVDKNVGKNKSVNVTGYTLSNSDAKYYTLAQPTELTANITAKPITVTADSVSKKQKEADPKLTYTFEPALVEGDEFTGELTREKGEDVGKYKILQGTLTLGDNYEITFVEGIFTVKTGETGVKDVDKIREFSVYPSIISDRFTVETNTVNSTLSIYNLTGQKVYEQVLNSKKEVLNISHLQSGVYMIRINGEIMKIVKE